MSFQQPPGGFGPPDAPPPGAPPPGGLGPPCAPPGPGFAAPQGGFRPPPGYGSPAPGIPPTGGPGGASQTDNLATLSLVLGVLSIPGHFCCYLGWPLGILSIVFGIIAYLRINKEPHRRSGKGLALGGVITSAIGFLLIVGLFFAYGAAILFASP